MRALRVRCVYDLCVFCVHPLHRCILWIFTELYWVYALITTGVCWATMAVALCWAVHMLGALYDTVAAVRDTTVPTAQEMRMRKLSM